MITRDHLKEILDYDEETGTFSWRIDRGTMAKKGDIAGSKWTNNKTGMKYIYIYIEQKNYRAHRLAWLYVYGTIPSFIDHVNGDGWDNSISNLREATKSQNACNRGKTKRNTSGYKGVFLKKNTGKWYAQIHVERKLFHKGGFETPELAHEWYCIMAGKLHGEFARTS